MKIIRKFAMAISVFLLISTGLRAQVPQMINYQGRVVVGTVNFDGSGGFRFALVNGNGSTTYWSNDGTSTAGSAPTGAVTLAVSKGLYTVLLGDTTLPNMTAVPASVFTPPDVRLRVWFNDGVHGTQLLAPDQRIAAVGYAMMAGGVTDGAITAPKLAAGSVTADKLAAGVGTGNLPWQPVTGTAQQAQPNSGYLVGAGTLSTVTLPTAAAIGDVVRVSGTGVGGWKVAQNAGQTIRGINGNQFGISGISGISYPGSLSSVGFTTSQNLGNVNFAAVACSSDGNKIVAVGSYNFIYTSADAGSTWVTRETSRYWTAVCSSPDGTKLAATVGGGFIYTSTDSGVTWTARLTDAARSWVAIASTSGGQYLLAADSNLLYESNDYGVTWTAESQTANQWTAVAYAKTATTQTLVAGWDAGLFVSHDFTTFTSIPNINTWGAASLAISADGTVVYLARKSYTGYLFRSTDSGTTFSSLASSPFDNFVSVACSPDGTHVVAASFQPNSKIYTSADSGATWATPSPTTAGGPWGYVRSSLAISADGTKLVAVGTGFVLTSADSGATWIQRGIPKAAASLHWKALAATDSTLFAADGVAGQIYHAPASTGAFYLDITTPVENWADVAASSDSAKAVACVDGGRIYTANLLDVWTAQPGSPVANWSSVVCSSDRAKIAATVRGGRIYTSGDSGVTWTAQPGSPNVTWSALAGSSDGTKLVAVVAGGFIYTSADSGVTWTARANDANRNWTAVTSSASGANLAAVVNGGGVYTSADFGATWTAQPALPTGPWSSISCSADEGCSSPRPIPASCMSPRISACGGYRKRSMVPERRR